MAKVQKFEELKIWQVAREVAKRVYELTRCGEFAKDFGLKDQIQRAAVSIGSNIAEGFERDSNSELMKFRLLQVFSGTQMLRIRKFGEMPCGYDGAAMEFSFSLPRLRHNGISPRLCKRHSLNVWDSLLFNRLMRNFKRNPDYYERKRRNFDRIELWRSRAEKTKIPTARRRSHTDSVETSRTTNVVCVPLKTSMNRNFSLMRKAVPERSDRNCKRRRI